MALRRLGLLAFWIAAASCKAGQAPSDVTLGELGRVEFKYQRSCFFGCPLEQPLLDGTRERIEMSTPADAEGLSVESGDPAIVAVALTRGCYCERSDTTGRLELRDDASCPGVWRKHCDNTILVEALQQGEAELSVLDARDKLIDRVQLSVQRAHDAQFTATLPDKLGPERGTEFELGAGTSLELSARLFDEDGLELLAPEGVAWHVDDINVATLSGFLTGRGADVRAGLEVSVQGVSSGDARVQLSVPGLDASVRVRIVQ